MASSTQYAVNSQNIIHETIDDEVVIVDLDKGFYYSLRSSAAQIWSKLIAGHSEEEIIKTISDRYDIDLADVESPVIDFIHQLVDENIISQASSEVVVNNPIRNESLMDHAPNQGRFTAPVMEKFTDMSELLLLDPIHEVDETGWPNMAPDQATYEEE